ncbi:hypothetical protein Bhyg_00474 [Pseudolycoriella hygida]|uniref:Retrovirus-related Pol polyprotein from transposon TNT 1-94-like beta-barrel domain-containing protein n=1 Tax=Pseudolycoriella hygida TaxID=35572 RepID=A0A9Q0N7T2_9DIPT|nr:hypothetical protein Bhyg_00474 [Pseudolycoriella hygida]
MDQYFSEKSDRKNKLNQYIKHIGNVNFHPFIALMGPIHKFYRKFSIQMFTKRLNDISLKVVFCKSGKKIYYIYALQSVESPILEKFQASKASKMLWANSFIGRKSLSEQVFAFEYSFNCPEKKKNQMSTQNVNKIKRGAFVVSSAVLNDNEWFLESATSFHMSPRADWMKNPLNKPIDHIVAANNEKLEVKAAGVVEVNVSIDGVENEISIRNVLHVPDLSSNLLSISQLCQKGHTVIFRNEGCQIFDAGMNLTATGRHVNNMFLLNVSNNCCLFTADEHFDYKWDNNIRLKIIIVAIVNKHFRVSWTMPLE